MTITWILLGSCVAITAMAAVTDYRTGRIPNWLTLPPLVVGPLLHFVSGGPTGLLGALVAIAVCGLVPYLMFRCGAIGGGDVKLFAAMGALCVASVASGNRRRTSCTHRPDGPDEVRGVPADRARHQR